jgi:hypothetical protein
LSTASRIARWLGLMAVSGLLGLAGCASPGAAPRNLPPDPHREAFVTFFPLYEMTRLRFNLIDDTTSPRRTELHRFNHLRRLLDHTSRAVSTPNNDTLYSSARLDLRAGPVRVEVPAMPGRYHSLQFIDAHTENAAIVRGGTGPAGASAPTRLWVVGPGSAAALPQPAPGEQVVKVATHDVWLLVRVLVDGPADIAAVAALQEAMRITAPQPAAAYPVVKSAPPKDPTPEQFLATVNEALERNPPSGALATQVRSLAVVGLGGAGWSGLDAAARQRWLQAWPTLTALLRQPLAALSRSVAGWEYPPPELGRWSGNTLLRATVALQGIGALEASEALYLSTSLDSRGQPLMGQRRYRVVVPAGGLPVREQGFWSLTMYEVLPDGRLFLTANPMGRYSVGDRTRGLVRAADGSLVLALQRTAPAQAAAAANWLPTPAGPFRLMLRAYLPTEALATGGAALPRVEPVPDSVQD